MTSITFEEIRQKWRELEGQHAECAYSTNDKGDLTEVCLFSITQEPDANVESFARYLKELFPKVSYFYGEDEETDEMSFTVIIQL
jgi:hypothetical protein